MLRLRERERAVGLHAPDLDGGEVWLNSAPLRLRDLRGRRVALLDFWTYTCVNCLRTIPYLKAWHQRYADAGLVVVGVHTPEFDFEADPRRVVEFVQEHGIRYPVVLDNRRTIWSAYANRYWPRTYLIDARGIIRYDHIGEGGYAETERTIQALLRELRPDVQLPPVASPEDADLFKVCYPTTPELYAGFYRGRLGNPGGYVEDRVAWYDDPGERQEGTLYLHGLWEATADYVRHARATGEPEDYLALHYQGLEVNAVLRSLHDTQLHVVVTRDGAPLPRASAGLDVAYEQGTSFVAVDEPRMYNLVRDAAPGRHELRLSAAASDLAVYALTFGGCPSVPPQR